MSDALQAIALLTVAVFAVGVVANRDPLPQAIAFSFFGLSLFVLFLVLQAPDVSLSAMVVGALAYPLMTLLTLAKVRDRER